METTAAYSKAIEELDTLTRKETSRDNDGDEAHEGSGPAPKPKGKSKGQ